MAEMMDPQDQWWERRREPVQLHLKIPLGSDQPKPAKVRKSCLLILGAIVLRLIGLVIAAVLLGYGGWCFYQIVDNLSLTPLVEIVAQGAFLIFIGGLSLLAELRTRWTMRGCISTYVLFSNHLARGIIYMAVGGILFALKHDPPYIERKLLALGIMAGGLLNVVYYPFYWKYQRRRDISKVHEVPLEPYPEEIIYGMDAHYKNITQPLPQPIAQSTTITNEGANVSPMGSPEVGGATEPKEDKKKDIDLEVTPGGPIDIIVETPSKVVTCADEARVELESVQVVRNEPIGVGAS